jgi:WD40 repeat protein
MVACVSDTLDVWDIESGRQQSSAAAGPQLLHSMALSRDGRLVAVGRLDASLALWDAASGRWRRLAGHGSAILCLAFSPDGRTLATGGSDGTVKVWDVPTGQELLSLESHSGPVHCLAFSGDGRTLITAAGTLNEGAGEVRLWKGTAEPVSAAKE